MKVYEGEFLTEKKKFGIIVSRFNGFVTEKLLDGAVDCLLRQGAKADAIEVFKVPGSFEIPATLNHLLQKKKFDAIICLSAVIRGETPHFDFIAHEVSKGIAELALDFGIPIGFGIITADNIEQAIERAGGKQGNKGEDAANSVMEQLGLLAKIK